MTIELLKATELPKKTLRPLKDYKDKEVTDLAATLTQRFQEIFNKFQQKSK